MASNTKSDNKKRQDRLSEILPHEVHGSHFTDSLFGVSFDRHLSKDDGERIAGFIGQGNNNVLNSRQIIEDTTFRQAYQLQPVAKAIKGTTDTILSYEHFIELLSQLGVDIDRLPQWANSTSFNFAPPINIDMLINYVDYFWDGPEGLEPQYITIENRCDKLSKRVTAYDQMLQAHGTTFAVSEIDVVSNTMVIEGSVERVFVPDFVFYTSSQFPAFNDKYWTVVESFFEVDIGTTTIILEPMATQSDTAPSNPALDQLWFNTTQNVLYTWSGTQWVAMPARVTATISLTEMYDQYVEERDCACHGDLGWDIKQWDDNQADDILWNRDTLAQISFFTEAEWEAANPGPKTGNSMWYDTQRDTLNLWSVTDNSWKAINRRFSVILSQTEGKYLFDKTKGCEVQVLNDWSRENYWKHKTEITSFAGVTRAQLPIIEFSSDIELNEWMTISRIWKYRSSNRTPFESKGIEPCMLELAPIHGFVVDTVGNEWVIYLHDKNTSIYRDVNYLDTFVPGFQFAIRNDLYEQQIYTVKSSTYRTLTSADSATVRNRVGTDVAVTVITLREATYTGPKWPTANRERIEPIKTSNGDLWGGYQVHWLLDVGSAENAPSTKSVLNTYSHTPTKTDVHRIDGFGIVTVTDTYQLVGVFADNVTTFPLQPRLRPKLGSNNFFATTDSITVSLNGEVLTPDRYTLNTANFSGDYVVVGDDAITCAFKYVTAVVLHEATNRNDFVKIEVGALAQHDIGKMNVPVRTIEDDAEFMQAVAQCKQPIRTSLHVTDKYTQKKEYSNQYPAFNIFDILTNHVLEAEAPFKFAEHEEMPLNQAVKRRILVTPDGRDFGFEQFLVKEDNGELFGYRDLSTVKEGDMWYNERLKSLQIWTEGTWTPYVIEFIPSRRLVTPIIADTAPLSATEMDIWYNPEINQAYRFISGSWKEQDVEVIVSLTDPTIYTIWRTGKVPTTYIPKKVNKDREPWTGEGEGVWELLDSWYHNISHDNRKQIKFSELTAHFRSMLRAQSSVSGMGDSGNFTLTQRQYNLGLGGSIKEFNDSLDTLVSAMNVQNSSPVSIINFARSQYGFLLNQVRMMVMENATETYSGLSADSMINITPFVIKNALNSLERNNFLATIYGDSTSYDAATGVGVKNWIATLPINRMLDPVVPTGSKRGNSAIIIHHDGHRSEISMTPIEVEGAAMVLCRTPDPRRPNDTLGRVASRPFPATDTQLATEFGTGAIRNGLLWFDTSRKKLSRFSPYTISDLTPSDSVPDGAMYYSPLQRAAYRFENGNWIQISSNGDISMLWVEVDFVQNIVDVIVEIEQRLYDRAIQLKDGRPTKVSDIPLTVADRDVMEDYLQKSFVSYSTEIGNPTPLANTGYTPANAFTWNYAGTVVSVLPTGQSTSLVLDGDWRAVYEQVYGTPYPNVEPWVLQGYASKPQWWDEEYKDTTGQRRWKYYHDVANSSGLGMWENIRLGIIPVGRSKPDGSISTTGNQTVPIQYNYMSVNIGNVPFAGIDVDDVLPPYVNIGTSPDPARIRSLFDNAAMIVSPNADFSYGQNGPAEWTWKNSVSYQYDQLAGIFVAQPIRTMHYLFGSEFTIVGHLQVEIEQKKVMSHKDSLFHGDVYDTNKQFKAVGMNQWYINYNKYANYDTNDSFRSLWSGWDPKLAYLTARTIDTEQLWMNHKLFQLTDRDYQTIFTNTGVLRRVDIDALRVSILYSPPPVIGLDNQIDWSFDVNTDIGVGRTIKLFKPIANTAILRNDALVWGELSPATIDVTAKRIDFRGNITPYIDGNDTTIKCGLVTYHITTSVYDAGNRITRVSIQEPITTTLTDQYVIDRPFTTQPSTGDLVHIIGRSGKIIPLRDDFYYYAVVTSEGIKLAESANKASSGVFVEGLSTIDDNTFDIAVIESTYQVLGGLIDPGHIWYHHKMDPFNQREITFPTKVYGMQHLLDIIDGIAKHHDEKDLVQFEGGDILSIDPDLGRANGWQLEIERFLAWASNRQKTQRNLIPNTYAVTVSQSDNSVLAVMQGSPNYENGSRVAFTSSGQLPAPLQAGTIYYFHVIDEQRFHVSTDRAGNDIVRVTGTSTAPMFMQAYGTTVSTPIAYEINPFRNAILLKTPKGIISDAFRGPYDETSTDQLVFDQFGNRLTSKEVLLYRQDEQTIISVTDGDDAERYLGGVRIYIEGYEHIITFNDYAVNRALIYDPFLGMNVQRIEIDMFRKSDALQRPTLGGYFLDGGKFKRNMEGAAEDLRKLFDIYARTTGTELTTLAQRHVGFNPIESLTQLGVGTRSQFIFYQGMIQSKGSNRSVAAFTNSKHYDGAEVDEFWARRVGTFGDTRPKLWPELKLTSSDSSQNDARFEFVQNGTSSDRDDEGNIVVPISFVRNNERWTDMPTQRRMLRSDPFIFKSQPSAKLTIVASNTPPKGEALASADVWYDKTNKRAIRVNNGYIKYDELVPNLLVNEVESTVLVVMDPFDAVHLSKKKLDSEQSLPNSTVVLSDIKHGVGYPEWTTRGYHVINATVIKLPLNDFEGIFEVYTMNSGFNTNSPTYIMDRKSGVRLKTVSSWNPAKGEHSYLANHKIDIKSDTDPALYNNTIVADQVSARAWNKTEVGTVWLDTNLVEYVPYYDPLVNNTINMQLHSWGHLAPWASINAYEWIESTIHPSQWNDEAVANPLMGMAKAGVFYRRRLNGTATIEKNSSAVIVDGDISSALQIGDGVTFYTEGKYPEYRDGGMRRKLTNSETMYVLTLSPMTLTSTSPYEDWTDATPIEFATDMDADDVLYVAREFSEDWKEDVLTRERIYIAYSTTYQVPDPVIQTTSFNEGDEVLVYINGKLLTSMPYIMNTTGTIILSGYVPSISDTIDVVRNAHAVTEEEEEFDPTVMDDARLTTQWKTDYQYTRAIPLGSDKYRYYFWVQNRRIRDERAEGELTSYEIALQYQYNPNPYYVTLEATNDQFGPKYRQVILRGIHGTVTEDNRYVWRINYNYTLRDELVGDLKPKHEQWQMFRRGQSSLIDRELWNKMIESITGHKIGSTIRVPSLDRELYDSQQGTSTRYGFGEGQAFTVGEYAKRSIIAYLNNPDIDFYPVDVDEFMKNQDFDTSAGWENALQEMYDTFPTRHVNNIWFDTLHDGLSRQTKYEGLMKTSWVAVSGMKLLDVGGVLDA